MNARTGTQPAETARRERCGAGCRDVEEAYRLLVDHSLQGLLILQEKRVAFANQMAADITGFPIEQMFMTPLEELLAFIHPEDRAMVRQRHEDRLQGRPVPSRHEFRVIDRDGCLRWLEIYASLVEYRGRPATQIALTDITAHKRVEEALVASEQQYRRLVETLQEGIWTLDRNHRTTFVNQHMAQMLGYTPEEMLDRHLFEFMDQQTAEAAARLIARPRQGIKERHECQFLRKDGRPIYTSIKAAPIADEAGNYIGSIAGITDITEQRQAAEALRVSEERSRRIFEDGPIGMVLTSRDFSFVRANPAFYRMLGYAPGEMDDLTFLDVTHPEHRDADRQNVEQLWEGKISCYRTEKRYLAKNGDTVWASVSASLIRSRGGRPLCALAFVEDITERKGALEQARQREAELLHVTRVSTLGELASGIAHELNQPLSAIANYGDACLRQLQAETPDVARTTRNLRQIVSQNQRAGEIIRRMQAMVKRAQPQFTAVDLNEVVRSVLALVRSEMAAKSVQLLLKFTEPLPRTCADTVQMEQVTLNLVRNAIEAMSGVEQPARRLTIRTQALTGNRVQMEVCDTGVGLPDRDPQQIFEPFFTTKAQGLGLGLSISRTIVQLHNGILTATRNTERGSTFTLVLPAQ